MSQALASGSDVPGVRGRQVGTGPNRQGALPCAHPSGPSTEPDCRPSSPEAAPLAPATAGPLGWWRSTPLTNGLRKGALPLAPLAPGDSRTGAAPRGHEEEGAPMGGLGRLRGLSEVGAGRANFA